MATCEKIEQTPVPPPPTYRLDLTADEHAALCSVLGDLPGGPDSVLYRIYDARTEAGRPTRTLVFDGNMPVITGWQE
jgi:hypothetical protein